MAANVGRTVMVCMAVLAMALQLSACNRTDTAQKAASATLPQVAAASSSPEQSAIPPSSSTTRANETETPKASDAPIRPMGKEEVAPLMPRPHPAKPLFDPRKGVGTLDPPRLLEA